MKTPLQTKDAAKLLDLGVDQVRELERKGLLRANRTSSGQRLFDEDQVKQLAKNRAAKKKER